MNPQKMPIRLPRYCYSCGVYLQGGATEHKSGCEFLRLIENAITRKAPKAGGRAKKAE